MCTGVQCSSGIYRMYLEDNMDGANCDRDDGSVGVCLGDFCAVSTCTCMA